jgi:hypothetical protein
MLEISPWKAKMSSLFSQSATKICMGLHVFFPILSKQIFSTDFNAGLHYKTSLKSSSSSQVVPCEQMDMMKIIVTFRNHAKAPEKSFTSHSRSNQYGPSRRIHKARVYVTLMYTDRSANNKKFQKG